MHSTHPVTARPHTLPSDTRHNTHGMAHLCGVHEVFSIGVALHGVKPSACEHTGACWLLPQCFSEFRSDQDRQTSRTPFTAYLRVVSNVCTRDKLVRGRP